MGKSPQASGEQKTTNVNENGRISWSDLLILGSLSTALLLIFGRLIQNLRRETIPSGDQRLTGRPGTMSAHDFNRKAPLQVEPRFQQPGMQVEGTGKRTPGLALNTTKPAMPTPQDVLTGSPHASTRWPVATKYVVGVILFLALVILIYVSRGVIPIIILAALLALIAHPVIHFLASRLKISRGLAIGLTYLLVIAILLTIPLIFIPGVINGINSLLTVDYQDLLENISQNINNLSNQIATIPIVNGILSPTLNAIDNTIEGITSVQTPDPVPLNQAVTETVDRLGQMLGTVTNLLGPLVSAITSLVFILLISFYLSFSVPQMRVGYPKLLPPAYEPEITGLFKKITGTWTSFLRGQLALMFIVGVMVWLGNSILGNTAPLLLGMISGLLELIPNLGPALALIPGVGFALLLGSSHFEMPNWTFAIIVLVFYLLVQVVENQLIVPYVLGGAVDLPPLAVILGVLVGGTVFGILGALLAVPMIATGREIFLYLYNKILEPPPVPEIPDEGPGLLGMVRARLARIRLPFGRGRKRPMDDGGEEALSEVPESPQSNQVQA